MAQGLGALTLLAEDSGLTPSIHEEAHSANSSSRGSNSLFWLSRTLCVYGTQTYMQANTQTYKIMVLPACAWM